MAYNVIITYFFPAFYINFGIEDYLDIETANLYRELLLSNYLDSKKEHSPEMLHSCEARIYYVKKVSSRFR